MPVPRPYALNKRARIKENIELRLVIEELLRVIANLQLRSSL
jgi:hypothetical protein